MTVEKSQKTLLFVAMAFPSFVRENVETLQIFRFYIPILAFKKIFSNVYKQIWLKNWSKLYEPIENHRMLFFDHPFGFVV